MSQEIKSKLKDLEKLEKEYNKDNKKFLQNNEKIESFLRAIISKEQRCLVCGEMLDNFTDEETELRNHEFGPDGHKFVKGFKNDIVRSKGRLIELSKDVYVSIEDYELYLVITYSYSPADKYPIVQAWNYFSDNGSYWWRKDILKMFEGNNLSTMFEKLKDEIVDEIKYKDRYIKESSEKVSKIDKIIDALGDLS